MITPDEISANNLANEEKRLRRAQSQPSQDRKGTFRGPSMHATIGWEIDVFDADVVSWNRFTRTASRTLRHPCCAMIGELPIQFPHSHNRIPSDRLPFLGLFPVVLSNEIIAARASQQQ